MASLLADEVLVTVILGVDSDTRVTQHGFGTGGSNLDELVGAFDGVLENISRCILVCTVCHTLKCVRTPNSTILSYPGTDNLVGPARSLLSTSSVLSAVLRAVHQLTNLLLR
jgi:hypothetical protein